MLVRDHEGRVFKTKGAMLKHYGVSTTRYNNLRNKGYSVKEALTNGPGYSPKHTRVGLYGEVYPTHQAMLEAYGLSTTTYYIHSKAGMTTVEILKRKATKWPKP